MKSAAMEFGEHNITVNALIPGLVDTALTRYEKRLSETMAEQGQKVDHPTPQQAWDNRAPTVALKVGWLQPDDISPAAVFLASDGRQHGDGSRVRSHRRRQRQGHLTRSCNERERHCHWDGQTDRRGNRRRRGAC